MTKKIFTVAVFAVLALMGTVAFTPADSATFEGTLELKQ